MLSDPVFLAAGVAAILIAGVSKGGFGSGAAFAATPLLALASSPQTAAGVMLPLLMAMDLTGLWAYRRTLDVRAIWPLMAAGVLGVGLGWLTFGLVDENALKVLLGALSLIFVLYGVARPAAARADAGPPRRPGWLGTLGWGATAGVTSFLAHAGGPPIAMHLLPQRLPKIRFQSTTVLFFAWVNWVKLGPYAALDLLAWPNFSVSLALAPLAPLAILLGVWAHKRVSEALYYRVIYVLLTLIGAKLMWDGITGG